jgi:hypothetical protein
LTRILDDLQGQVELEGHAPGTPEYERELRRLKVEQCQRMQGVGKCAECARYEYCDLRVAYGFDRKYRNSDADH